MAVWVVQQWSVRESDRPACDAALAAIAAHIRAGHPEVLAVRTHLQWVGTQAHRGYVWMEDYESLTGIESSEHTSACDEVWAPIHQLTLAGSHQRSVWFDADPTWTR